MPLFKYTAINRAGQHIDGEIEAADMLSARSLLSEQGRFVSSISDLGTISGTEEVQITNVPSPKNINKLRISKRDKQEFISQFATALRAKVPVMGALEVVSQQNPRKKVVNLVNNLSRHIRSGMSLSEAMAEYKYVFDRLDISLVRVGESTGNLDECMTSLAEVKDRELTIHNTIITSSLYPLFVLFIGLLSAVVVVTWIIPRIIKTLAVDVQWLPWPTRIMMKVSDFLNSPSGWIVVFGFGIAIIMFLRWGRTNSGRLVFDRIRISLPVIGLVNRKWAVARFARMLGVLIGNGVDMLSSLKVVRNCLDNEVLAREIDSLVNHVRAGASLVSPLKKSGLFPPLLIQVVSVGENTGKLPEMLINSADAFDKDTDRAVKRLMAIFPAILIFVLAIFIGFLLMATLLPIIQVETNLPSF